jgi:molybdopterin molybdotransferase
VVAAADCPDRPLAAIDGYALRAESSLGASDYAPLPVRLLSPESPAVPADAVCLRASGAPLPQGADALVPLDQAELDGTRLQLHAAVAPGEHVLERAGEARAGESVLPAGRRLRAQDLALLALLGVAAVPVVPRPRVRVLVLCADQGTDADGPLLAALVARDGGQIGAVEHPPRELEGLAAALVDDGVPADLTLVAGGSGLGPNDPAVPAAIAAGAQLRRGVALHPGETTALGLLRGRPLVLLPGPPLACLVAYDLIAGRILRRLAGGSGELPYACRRLPLTRKIASALGRLEYCRVRVHTEGVEPLAVADGRRLVTAVRADGFVLVPPQSEGWPEGREVTVHLYEPFP